MGELDEISMHYAGKGFQPSAGDRTLSTLEIISGHDLEWRDGEWVEARVAARSPAATYEFPDPVGRQRMIRYPVG